MKKLLIALLVLFGVLIAVVLIAPSFVDWNAYKDRIAEEVAMLTGRPIAIGGDVRLAILPTPTLSVGKLELANVEGASPPAMVKLEALEVRVALLPLLTGKVEVESISLVSPIVHLEVLPDGRRNWDFPPPEGEARPWDPGGGLGSAVRFDRVAVEDGVVIYRDRAAGRDLRLEGLEGRLAAEALQGPFDVEGEARIDGVESRFRLHLGRPSPTAIRSVDLGLRLPAAEADFRFLGTIDESATTFSARGRLNGEGPDLRRLAALFGEGAAEVPALFAQPFAVAGELGAADGKVSGRGFALDLGSIAFTGDLASALDAPYDTRLRLSAAQLNLDRFLAEAGEQAATPAALPQRPLPKGVNLALEMTVDAMIYRGQVLRQVLMSAVLAEGALELEQAFALLPGSSDLSLKGRLTMAPAGEVAAARFTGEVEASSDNLRATLAWLGADLSGLAPGRLRKMRLTSRLEATAEQATFTDLEVLLDLSRATGGIALALRRRPGLGIGLVIDRIDLDAYLPQPAAPSRGRVPAVAGGNGEDLPVPDDGEAPPEEAAGLDIGLLGDFDANLDIAVKRLGFRGAWFGEMAFDGTLHQGRLQVRDLQIGELVGGGTLKAKGQLTPLADPFALEAELALEAENPGRTLRAVGLRGAVEGVPPAALAQPLALTLKLAGTSETLEVEAQGTVLEGRALVKGAAHPAAAETEYDLTFEVSHPEAGRLAATLLATETPPGEAPPLGALGAKGRLEGRGDEIRLRDVDLAIGPLVAQGQAVLDLSTPEIALGSLQAQVEIVHSSLPAFARSLSLSSSESLPGGALKLSGRLTGEAGRYQLEELDGRLGSTELSGRLSLALVGETPSLEADLECAELPLALLAAPITGGLTREVPRGIGRRGPGRWSAERLDFTLLAALEADLKLRCQALLAGPYRLEDAEIEAALLEGVLDLRKLDGGFHGGLLSLVGKLDSRDEPKLGLSITASEVDLAALLRAAGLERTVGGQVDVSATLTSRGASEVALVTTLAGKGDFKGWLDPGEGAVEAIESWLGGALGRRPSELERARHRLVFEAFSEAPLPFRGSFAMERGIATTGDALLEGRALSAFIEGAVDLPSWLLRTRGDIAPPEARHPAVLSVELRGPLDAPAPRLLSGEPRPRPGGSGTPNAPEVQGGGSSTDAPDSPDDARGTDQPAPTAD